MNKTADDGNRNVTTYTYDDQNRVTGVSRKNGLEQTLKLIGAFSFCGKSKKDGGCRIYDLFNH
ncbi:hypothetical protein KQI13_03745 [Anaerostipes hadrus]|nr:hypothetical protein [Anaerostipes hadrus]